MRKLGLITLCLLAIFSLARAADVTNIFQPPAITCSAQFIRSIATITGVGSCATVSLTADITGTLGTGNGGTGNTGGAWTTFLPTVTCGTGSVGGYTTQVGGYQIVGKLVSIRIDIKPTAGTCSGTITIGTLPVAGLTAAAQVISGVDNVATTPATCLIGGGATVCSALTSAGANPGATDRLILNGVYESN